MTEQQTRRSFIGNVLAFLSLGRAAIGKQSAISWEELSQLTPEELYCLFIRLSGLRCPHPECEGDTFALSGTYEARSFPQVFLTQYRSDVRCERCKKWRDLVVIVPANRESFDLVVNHKEIVKTQQFHGHLTSWQSENP